MPKISSKTNRITRSKSASRSRSRSRLRSKNVPKSLGKPYKKDPNSVVASEPRINRSRKPSESSLSSNDTKPSKIENTSVRSKDIIDSRLRSAARIRSSLQSIEKLECSMLPADNKILQHSLNSKSAKSSKEHGLFDSVLPLTFCTRSLFNIVFSKSILYIFAMLFVPPFIFWVNFLIMSPTSSSEFGEFRETIWGQGRVFAYVIWPTNYEVYFDQYISIGLLFFVLTVIIQSTCIPLGRVFPVLAGGRRTEFRSNGIFLLIEFIILFALCEYKGAPYIELSELGNLWSHSPALLTSSLLLSLIISTVAYLTSVKRRSVVEDTETGNIIVDFYHGCDLRPRWFGVDIKMVMFRPFIFLTLLMMSSLVLRQYNAHNRLSPALLVTFVLYIIQSLDFLLFEPSLLSSYNISHEGFGYQRINALLFVLPFFYSLNILHLSENFEAGFPDIELNSQIGLLLSTFIIFITGLVVQRLSNNQKFLFRRDQQNVAFAAMATVPTASGRRLLAGGLWGHVRHPNYLGCILISIALALPAGVTSPLAWIQPILTTIFLIHRSSLVEASCFSKYGQAWKKYAALVPYRFIPRVY